MNHFFYFVVISLWDMFFTIKGIRNGSIEEFNPVIKFLGSNSIFDIYESVIVIKILFIMIAYWLITDCQVRLNTVYDGVTLKALLEEGALKRILLILTLFTAVFGALPSMIINIHYLFFFNR
jgi:hypothetical protein